MKVKNTAFDRILDTICWILVIGIPVFLLINWKQIPDSIPMHYDAMGNVDRWGTKGELIVLPIITVIMCLFISIIERFPQIWNTGVKVTEENSGRVYRILKNMLKITKFLVVADFSFMTVNSLMARDLPVWFSPVFLGLVFGNLIFWIIKLVKVK